MGIALEKNHWNQAEVQGPPRPRWGAGATPRWGAQGGDAPRPKMNLSIFKDISWPLLAARSVQLFSSWKCITHTYTSIDKGVDSMLILLLERIWTEQQTLNIMWSTVISKNGLLACTHCILLRTDSTAFWIGVCSHMQWLMLKRSMCAEQPCPHWLHPGENWWCSLLIHNVSLVHSFNM